MSPELIGIITVGVALFSANLAIIGFIVILLNRSETKTNQRIDRLEDRMDRGFEQMRSEMNQQSEGLRSEMNRRFDEQDVRIRGLEQGQSYMSGQFSELKDHLTHRSPTGNNPEPGD